LRWQGEFPHGGLHVNLAERTLATWWAPPTADLVAMGAAAWPGWQVRGWGDRYEPHFDLLGDRLALSAPRLADVQRTCLEHIARLVDREARNPARELAPRLGADVRISPATDSARGSVGDPNAKRAALATLAARLGLGLDWRPAS